MLSTNTQATKLQTVFICTLYNYQQKDAAIYHGSTYMFNDSDIFKRKMKLLLKQHNVVS